MSSDEDCSAKNQPVETLDQIEAFRKSWLCATLETEVSSGRWRSWSAAHRPDQRATIVTAGLPCGCERRITIVHAALARAASARMALKAAETGAVTAKRCARWIGEVGAFGYHVAEPRTLAQTADSGASLVETNEIGYTRFARARVPLPQQLNQLTEEFANFRSEPEDTPGWRYTRGEIQGAMKIGLPVEPPPIDIARLYPATAPSLAILRNPNSTRNECDEAIQWLKLNGYNSEPSIRREIRKAEDEMAMKSSGEAEALPALIQRDLGYLAEASDDELRELLECKGCGILHSWCLFAQKHSARLTAMRARAMEVDTSGVPVGKAPPRAVSSEERALLKEIQQADGNAKLIKADWNSWEEAFAAKVPPSRSDGFSQDKIDAIKIQMMATVKRGGK